MSTQIKHMPARMPEVGRIRLGVKGERGQPVKGETLRFTSNDRDTLEAVAARLGGTVEEWPDGEQSWQLTSGSDSVDAYLPPDAIDTTYERWGSGGIARRCDGERCVVPVGDDSGGHLEETDCVCLTEDLVPGDRGDVKKGACQVTVRLRLILPDLPGLGVWLCTSHSIYAAMELPGTVGMLRELAGDSRLIPVTFAMEHRSEKKPWEKYRREYLVPVFRSKESLSALASGPAAGNGAAVGPARAEIAAAPPVPAAASEEGTAAAEGYATPSAAPPSTDAADAWDVESIRARLAEHDDEIREAIGLEWLDRKFGSISPNASTARPLAAAEVVAVVDMIGRIADENYLRRQKSANAAMAEAGIKSDDARHELVKLATDGATSSTKRLSDVQVAAVRDKCEELAKEDVAG